MTNELKVGAVDTKFSQFAPGGLIRPTDKPVGLRGTNTQFDMLALPQGMLWGGNSLDRYTAINLKSANGSIVVVKTVDGEIDFSVSTNFLPTLGQGQFTMGVADSPNVAGQLRSLDNSVLIDASVPGYLNLTAVGGGGGGGSLQSDYNIGNTIDLDPARPLTISRFQLGSPTNAVVSSSGGGILVSNYNNVAYRFTTNTTRVINAVQYIDANFTQPGTRQVSIYLRSTGQLLATGFVSKTDPLDGIFRTVQLSTLLQITPGVEYVLACVIAPGEYSFIGPTPVAVPASGINILGYSLGPSNANPIPTSMPSIFNSVANITPAGFFQFQDFTADSQVIFTGDDTVPYFYKVASTTQGAIHAPPMSTSEINAILSPIAALNAYDNTINRHKFHDGSLWKTLLGLNTVTATGIVNPMAPDSCNIANDTTLVEFQTPPTFPKGTFIFVFGQGSGGWKIGCTGSQKIRLGTTESVAGGTLTGATIGDCVILFAITANTEWIAFGVEGNLLQIDA